MTLATAPGKCILFGEHAVVYGRPAIAIPLPQLRARVDIQTLEGPAAQGLRIQASDIGVDAWLHELAPDDPLRRIVELTLTALQAKTPELQIHVHSDIPIASGMGSGAAVSVALARGLSRHLGAPLSNRRVSELAFDVEKLHHGTPSGIDNTVIAYEKGVYYTQEAGPEIFQISGDLRIVIGDTGVPSPTREAVRLVREAWQRHPADYEGIFDQIGAIVRTARSALLDEGGADVGKLMDENQTLLERLQVSNPALRALISAARDAGAKGAKLSGAGLGGIMIALPPHGQGDLIRSSLEQAGAVRTYLAEFEA